MGVRRGAVMSNRILLVDDDREFRSEFKEYLSEYDVMEAENGADALKILKKANDIDLVILDVKMPGISGTEVLREIRKIDPNLGVIILTAYSSENVAVEALKGHADDYMEKPLDIARVRETIEKILEAKALKRGNNIDLRYVRGKIEKIKRFVEKNYGKKVSLDDAAAIVSLSPKYLSRIFKQLTGTGFNEYKLACKMKEAKALLAETGYTVGQISHQMGYENAESFIRAFEKITGYSPSQYRRANSKKAKPQ